LKKKVWGFYLLRYFKSTLIRYLFVKGKFS